MLAAYPTDNASGSPHQGFLHIDGAVQLELLRPMGIVFMGLSHVPCFLRSSTCFSSLYLFSVSLVWKHLDHRRWRCSKTIVLPVFL